MTNPIHQSINRMFRIAVFASGSGTNAEEIFNYFSGHKSINVAGLLSNNPEAYALERARKYNVPTMVFNRKQFKESSDVVNWLEEKDVTHLVLAGFLWLVPESLINAFSGKIINIHPALLPKYGGKGMYGMKVHEAVRASGDTETGITIHEVNEKYDEGNTLFKAICPVKPGDSPEEIAHRVHQLEYAWYPKVIEDWVMRS